MRKLLILAVLSAAFGADEKASLERARQLYERKEYKRASEMLEELVRQSPGDFELHLWLGRAYGRRAETSSFVTAPGLAVKARKSFEQAVALNPKSREAGGDLLDYYLGAPGFLGGGIDKAVALAERLKDLDPPEYHYRMAQIAMKKKDLKAAEEHFRKALEMEPDNPSRRKDLAEFLAKQGRSVESHADR
ncbi:MAG: tetratricopeptide repeat protein [Bryobacteraceae bacterium]